MLYALARPLLFALEPETAHALALGLADAPLRLGLLRVVRPPERPVLAMGLRFRNPVGLAAGLDKDAEHVDALAALGFGFLELGGVTPRPQPGNPKPRLFRIPQARALVNRMGLNSAGLDAFVENLRRARRDVVIGVNIGKNGDTPNERAGDDYERCLEALYPYADYVSINVSSPNTPGLRELQSPEALAALLARLGASRARLRDRYGRDVKLVPKISPDLDAEGVRAVADVVRRTGMDGVIATNTTVSREGVEGLPNASERGGLSGAPLRPRALAVLRALVAHLAGEIPVIGVGGIMSGADAAERFAAGATLVQLYTGLVYRGPALVAECVRAYPGERPRAVA
ncbi:MAG: quinone-dependent dihydroorotate dehydrogenase [Burkholderiales bacterium]|nr:quinone-dependent dihydroorotate dehydrogenase [Burkholderiales bacterium]